MTFLEEEFANDCKKIGEGEMKSVDLFTMDYHNEHLHSEFQMLINRFNKTLVIAIDGNPYVPDNNIEFILVKGEQSSQRFIDLINKQWSELNK